MLRVEAQPTGWLVFVTCARWLKVMGAAHTVDVFAV